MFAQEVVALKSDVLFGRGWGRLCYSGNGCRSYWVAGLESLQGLVYMYSMCAGCGVYECATGGMT